MRVSVSRSVLPIVSDLDRQLQFAGPRRSIREELERIKQMRQLTNRSEWKRSHRSRRNHALLWQRYEFASSSSLGDNRSAENSGSRGSPHSTKDRQNSSGPFVLSNGKGYNSGMFVSPGASPRSTDRTDFNSGTHLMPAPENAPPNIPSRNLNLSSIEKKPSNYNSKSEEDPSFTKA